MDESVSIEPAASSPLGGHSRPDLLPLVVSVVVNYRGLADTLACVDSLRSVQYPRHRVLVVENGSGSQEADALSTALPSDVHLIVSETNHGYGGAANLGLRWAAEAGAAYGPALTPQERSASQATASGGS